jgi:hypothetical protein
MAKMSVLEARVVTRKAGPVLEVNGKPTAPLILFVNLTSDNPEAGLSTVRRAAAAGVNIVSFVCHHFPMPKPGEQPDYRQWDDQVEAILRANPKALLIPRIGMSNVPRWWAQENPDEMMLYDNGQRGMVSVASEKWRRDAGEALRLLLRRLEEKFGAHMLGYHPCGQNTGEWFYDRVWENLLPSFETPMEAAFRSWLKDRDARLPTAQERRSSTAGSFLDPAKQRRLLEFLAFQQDAMVEPLRYFARIIKEETRRRKLVVYFYGYTFELSALPGGPAVSGHLALERLLKCRDIDIVCSPVSYFDRQPGGAGPFMAPIDSVQLHGKLWLNEDDTRTYLSRPEDGFGRAGTTQETFGVHRRNLAHVASRSSALWWMDLPGAGWLDSAEIWDNCARLKRVYEAVSRARRTYRPEVAVVVDEESLLYLSYGRQIGNPLLYELRRELYRIGAPLGFYLLSDVCAGRVEWPKVYIFLNAFALDEAKRQALLRHVRRPGKTAVWFYAPGFIKGSKASAELVSEVTGIQVREESGTVPARAVVTKEALGTLPGAHVGEEFGPAYSLSPLFHVSDAEARPLAVYVGTGRVAAAFKEMACSRGAWKSVFIGPPSAALSLLREIARSGGAHVYLQSDDIVMAGNGIVAVHAASEGGKVLSLPRTCALKDAPSGYVVLSKGRELPLSMKRGETGMFARDGGD